MNYIFPRCLKLKQKKNERAEHTAEAERDLTRFTFYLNTLSKETNIHSEL